MTPGRFHCQHAKSQQTNAYSSLPRHRQFGGYNDTSMERVFD